MAVLPNTTQEVAHLGKRVGMYVVGKHFAVEAGPAIVSSEGVMSLGVVSEAWAPSIAMGATLGLAALISAALTQMDYRHKRENIKNFYADELGAKLGKSADQVQAADLEAFSSNKSAAVNSTIREAIGKEKKQRNFGIGFSVAATMASLGVVMAAASVGMFDFATLGHAAAPIVEFIAKGAAAVLSYNAVKMPLHALGDKLFGLDKETTHDRIMALAREREAGNAVTREQVQEVFASAGTRLDGAQLSQVTERINQGAMNASQLAFAVDAPMPAARQPRPLVEYDNPAPSRSFLTSLGREKIDAGKSFVELTERTGERSLS